MLVLKVLRNLVRTYYKNFSEAEGPYGSACSEYQPHCKVVVGGLGLYVTLETGSVLNTRGNEVIIWEVVTQKAI